MAATTQESDTHSVATPKSVEASWQYAQELWSSETGSAAWTSFKNLIGALPAWALAIVIVALFGLLSHSVFVLIPVVAAGFLVATFITVKRAVLGALREHESRPRY